MHCVRLLLSAGLVTCLLLGCGSGEKPPELVPVTGTVWVNGEPAPDMLVTFQPVGGDRGNLATGQTDAQGKYELKYRGEETGAVPGKHRVTIQHANEAEVSEDQLLPPRFNTESTLTAEVTPDKTEYDFQLDIGR